uniref:Putative ixodes 10 kDa peptide protein n=1 Tax=Ixodes ricinus TaxID=34613 RepID=A0A0K8RJ37_IXORI
MQLVVFAALLILPSFLSGELSATFDEVSNECEGSIVDGGTLACEKKGSHYSGYDLQLCIVKCANRKKVKLPDGVCLNGKVKDCTTEDVKRELKKWMLKIKKRSTK